jgi:hypothetical protein
MPNDEALVQQKTTTWLPLALAACGLLAAAARAADPGTDSYMVRVLACEGPDAGMEIYLPQSIVFRGDAARDEALQRPVIGMYALDLTGANKGKLLEPVRVRLSPDKRTLTIDQYTRNLPPTRVPVEGGTVDFDKRFGAAAECGRFGAQEE